MYGFFSVFLRTVWRAYNFSKRGHVVCVKFLAIPPDREESRTQWAPARRLWMGPERVQ